jgi:hypothetical protein
MYAYLTDGAAAAWAFVFFTGTYLVTVFGSFGEDVFPPLEVPDEEDAPPAISIIASSTTIERSLSGSPSPNSTINE